MKQLNPIEWAILPLKKYATFSGRAPRAEYWWFYLLTVIVGILTKLLDTAIGSHDTIKSVANLALLLPVLAVTVRRLHDTERSGWWLLLLLAAVAVAVFIALAGALTSTATSFTAMIVMILILLGAGVTLLVMMVQPGTRGPNEYGPDPYGPSELEEVFA